MVKVFRLSRQIVSGRLDDGDRLHAGPAPFFQRSSLGRQTVALSAALAEPRVRNDHRPSRDPADMASAAVCSGALGHTTSPIAGGIRLIRHNSTQAFAVAPTRRLSAAATKTVTNHAAIARPRDRWFTMSAYAVAGTERDTSCALQSGAEVGPSARTRERGTARTLAGSVR